MTYRGDEILIVACIHGSAIQSAGRNAPKDNPASDFRVSLNRRVDPFLDLGLGQRADFGRATWPCWKIISVGCRARRTSSALRILVDVDFATVICPHIRWLALPAPARSSGTVRTIPPRNPP